MQQVSHKLHAILSQLEEMNYGSPLIKAGVTYREEINRKPQKV